MTLKTRKWDVVEHLKTEEDMALYLQACLNEAPDDAAFILANCDRLHGFYGASSMERLPTEIALTETTRRFKAIGSRHAPTPQQETEQ